MSDNNIRRFPISGTQRRRNRLGRRAVPCLVTDRWLQFSEEAKFYSSRHDPAGHYFEIEVMTAPDHEKPRKLCSLMVSKESLLSALNEVAEK